MRKAKILLVEDESIVALDISQRLEALGYEVVGTVPDGVEAIKLAEKKKPNLVLMDIVIKGEINGIRAGEEIAKRFKIPIVYLTAYSPNKTATKTELTGQFHITKPFEDEDLQRIIENALSKSQYFFEDK